MATTSGITGPTVLLWAVCYCEWSVWLRLRGWSLEELTGLDIFWLHDFFSLPWLILAYNVESDLTFFYVFLWVYPPQFCSFPPTKPPNCDTLFMFWLFLNIPLHFFPHPLSLTSSLPLVLCPTNPPPSSRLSPQLSLRRQQVSEKLNEWAVFNEKNKELCEWLTQMESKVSQNGDISIEEMIEKLRKVISAHYLYKNHTWNTQT